jgi:hypothetical protein
MSRALRRRVEKLERAANAEKFFIIDAVKARGLWEAHERYTLDLLPPPRDWEKIQRRARAIRCPPSYGSAQLMTDYERIQDLSWRRHHPQSEKPLSAAEDAAEVQATARYLAYYASPRGPRRRRIMELLRKRRSAPEQRELDNLCQQAREDGENWPRRRELLQSKPAFELIPEELLELEALNEQACPSAAPIAGTRTKPKLP